MKLMTPEEIRRAELEALQAEHVRLDQEVADLSLRATTPTLDLQRLKKRKLALKDRIKILKDQVNPDIIA